MTTELPPFLLAIAGQLHSQDNLGTASPMFCVQRRNRIVGIDTDYCEGRCWLDGANEETIYDDDPIFTEPPSGGEWDEYGYKDVWETFMACFTRKGAEDYLRANGHNLGKVRIYVESFYRCAEMIGLRDWLMTLPLTSK